MVNYFAFVSVNILFYHWWLFRWFSAEVRSLIDLVLVPDPKHRMTIEQIRQHPWFLEGPPAQVRGDQSELGNASDAISQVQIQPSEAEVASAVQVCILCA